MSTVSSPPALTTLFKPSPSCLTDTYVYGTIGNTWFYELGPPITDAASDCFPPSWIPQSTAYFSPAPGLCPLSYNLACSSLVTSDSRTETRATCCPSGYACYTDGAPWFLGQLCTSQVNVAGTITVTSSAAGGHETLSVLAQPGDGLNAYGVELRWHSRDLSLTATSTSTSTSSSSTSTTTSSPSSSSSTATGTPTPSTIAHTGLSNGAKAGIGIGVALVVVIALGFGALLFYLRRKGKRQNAQSAGSGYGAVTQYDNGEGHDLQPLSGRQKPPAQELYTSERPQEIYTAPREPQELSSHRGYHSPGR